MLILTAQQKHIKITLITTALLAAILFQYFPYMVFASAETKDSDRALFKNEQLLPSPWQPILGFPHADLFQIDREILSARKKALLFAPISGVAINAPRHINTTEQNSLPLLLASKIDGIKSWSTPLLDNTYISAIDHSTGKVAIKSIFISEKARRHYRPADPKIMAKPQAGDADNYGVNIDLINIRDVFDISWRDGQWTFRALYFDRESNPVTVTLHTQDLTSVQTSMNNQIFKESFVVNTPESIKVPLKYTTKGAATNADGEDQYITLTYRTANKKDAKLKDSLIIDGHLKFKQVKQSTSATAVLLKKNDARSIHVELNLLIAEQPPRLADTLYSNFSFDLLASRKNTALKAGDYVLFLFIGTQLIGPAYFNVPS